MGDSLPELANCLMNRVHTLGMHSVTLAPRSVFSNSRRTASRIELDTLSNADSARKWTSSLVEDELSDWAGLICPSPGSPDRHALLWALTLQ